MCKAVDGVVIGKHAIDGRLVELKVARVHNTSLWRLEKDSQSAWNGVRHREEINREGTQLNARTIRDFTQLPILNAMFSKFALDKAQC